MQKYINILLALLVSFFMLSNANAADKVPDSNWADIRTINAQINNKPTIQVSAQKTYPVSTLDQNGRPIAGIRTAKSTIKLTPKTISKTLGRRMPQALMVQAVIAVLGKSVDWVMDEENNRVKYNEPSSEPYDGNSYKVDRPDITSWSSSKKLACIDAIPSLKSATGQDVKFVSIYPNGQCQYAMGDGNLYQNITTKPDLDGPPKPKERYVTFDQIADEVVDDAANGSPRYRSAIDDAVKELARKGELRTPFDQNANYPQPDPDLSYPYNPNNMNDPANPSSPLYDPNNPAQPNNPYIPGGSNDPNNPNSPDINLEFPAFCSWASVVCEYIIWVKQEYTDMKQWLRQDPADLEPIPVETTDIDIGDWEQKANAGYVNFSAECPAGVNIPVTFMNTTSNINISYAPFCRFASLIKPAVIFGAWISAMMIISGGRSKE